MIGIGHIWKVMREVEDVLKLQEYVRGSIAVFEDRLRTIEDRMLKLEADERQVVTEAKAAAQAAAMMIAGNLLSDVVTRITKIEGAMAGHQPRQPPSARLKGPPK